MKRVPEMIALLGDPDPRTRNDSAAMLFTLGRLFARSTMNSWIADPDLSSLLVRRTDAGPRSVADALGNFKATVGVATSPENFGRIRRAHGSPRLADVPPDQDAMEFELHTDDVIGPPARLDILTSKSPEGNGAIANFLRKFGEGIQQVEFEVSDVDGATKILAERFAVKAIYPATRPGADGTRVNFFLVPTEWGNKVLIELVEAAR